MKKIAFLGGMLSVLLLIGCTKDHVIERIIYKSEPVITRIPLEEHLDSVQVTGYSQCVSREMFKGALPPKVAEDSGLEGTFTYYTYMAKANMTLKDDEALSMRNFDLDSSIIGYDEMFTRRTFFVSSVSPGNTSALVTCLIYIKKDSKGNAIDRWFPVAPEELDWKCRLYYDLKK